MNKEQLASSKKEINKRSYESLLSLWRNAPSGHPYFQGELGKHFSSVMSKKKSELSASDQVQASKNIGWG